MGLTRDERIARELAKEWPDGDRHHYVLVASKEHGIVSVSGASSERMRDLLGQVLAEALGLDNTPCKHTFEVVAQTPAEGNFTPPNSARETEWCSMCGALRQGHKVRSPAIGINAKNKEDEP